VFLQIEGHSHEKCDLSEMVSSAARASFYNTTKNKNKNWALVQKMHA